MDRVPGSKDQHQGGKQATPEGPLSAPKEPKAPDSPDPTISSLSLGGKVPGSLEPTAEVQTAPETSTAQKLRSSPAADPTGIQVKGAEKQRENEPETASALQASSTFLEETDREDLIVVAEREYSCSDEQADSEDRSLEADEGKEGSSTQENKPEPTQVERPSAAAPLLESSCSPQSPPQSSEPKPTASSERVIGPSSVQQGFRGQSRSPLMALGERDPTARIEVPRPPEHVHPELDAKLDELFEARHDISSLGFREQLVTRFNRALMKKCNQLGLQFLDVNKGLIENSTGELQFLRAQFFVLVFRFVLKNSFH